MIHHIRRQPEEIKRHILHAVTGVFAAVLFLLWVYSLGNTLTSDQTQNKVTQDLKPFSALKANILGGYNSITENNSEVEQQ